MIKQGIQNLLENAGKWGCYYLCILWIISRDFSLQDVYDCIEAKYLDEEFTVLDAGAIATFLGKRSGSNYWYTHHKEGPDYVAKPNEVLIGRFVYLGNNHFVVLDRDKRVAFNPLNVSQCVEKGKLESVRALTKKI